MSDAQSMRDLILRFSVGSPRHDDVVALATAVGVEVKRRDGWSKAQLITMRREAKGGAELDAIMAEFAREFSNLIDTLGAERIRDIGRAELAIALIPNDSMNAGFYLPPEVIRALASLNIRLFFSAY